LARLLRKRSFSAGAGFAHQGTVFFSVNDHDKPAAITLARRYIHLGFKIVATEAQS